MFSYIINSSLAIKSKAWFVVTSVGIPSSVLEIWQIDNTQQTPQEPQILGRYPRTCTMSWQCSFHHSSPFRGSTRIFDSYGDPWGHLCAPTPTGSTTCLLLGEQGATLLSVIFWRVYSSIWHFRILLGLLEGPTTCAYYYSTPYEAYFSIYELVWWTCHQ